MDAVFRALAHPVRRRILDLVKARPGSNLNDVSAGFEISRIAVLKHVNTLEAAELLVSEKDGRDRRLYFNVVPIQAVYDRWTSEYSAYWASGLLRAKYRIEMEESS